MPIEPTSVSKPVVREVDNVSGAGLWNSKHGSSTGGKDSPFSSIWEKTVHGAQKLLGLDKANESAQNDRRDEDGETRETGSRSSVSSGLAEPEPLNAVPGFGNRTFTGYLSGSGNLNVFTSVMRAQPKPDKATDSSFNPSIRETREYDFEDKGIYVVECDGHAPEPDSKEPISETSKKPERRAEGDSDEDESDESEKRNASALPAPPLPSIESRSADSISLNLTNVAGNARPADLSTTLGQPDSAPEPTSVGAAVPVNQTATPQKLPSENVAELAAEAKPTAATSATQTGAVVVPMTTSKQSENGLNVSKANELASGTKATANASASIELAKAVPGTAEQKAAVDTTRTSLTAESKTATTNGELTEDSQELDFAHNKKAVVDTLIRASEKRIEQPTTKIGAQASVPGGNAQAAAAEKPLASSSLAQGKAEQGAEMKTPVVQDVPAKEISSHVANKAGQGVASLRSSGSEAQVQRNAVAEATVESGSTTGPVQRSQSANTVNTAHVAREANRPVAAPAQNRPLTQNTGSITGATGLAGGATATTTPGTAGANAQSKNGDASENSKQEFSAQLKNATSGKGTEKSSNDSGQSFDVKGADGDSKKAAAASKARPTSYVTKTAEEVKEVVATLTKSIDRLVTNKGGAMNLRVNFDQGGSMTIRISMEGSQVSTSMQTDVVGLEGMIKSNWSELANDWNQKGLKLNLPQFQAGAGHSDGDGKADEWTEFANRQQEKQSGFNGAAGNGSQRNTGRREGSAQNSNGPASTPGNLSPTEEASDEVISDTELKTYA